MKINGVEVWADGLGEPGTRGDPEESQIEIAREYVRARCAPSSALCTISSYGLKHRVESRARKAGTPVYVSNGAFIAAALLEGYRMERVSNTPNARFRMRVSEHDASESFVYFIEAAELGRVKIGWTTGDPMKRLASLQTGSPVPLEIVATFPANDTDEALFHHYWRINRLHGEWFQFDDYMHDWIEGWKQRWEADRDGCRRMMKADRHFVDEADRLVGGWGRDGDDEGSR